MIRGAAAGQTSTTPCATAHGVVTRVVDRAASSSTFGNDRYLRKPDIADRSRGIAIWGKFAGRDRETARTDKSNWANL